MGLTGAPPCRGQQKEGDQTGYKTAETGSWRGDIGSDRDLSSRYREEIQRVKDGWCRLARWKLVWTGVPRPE